jgi:hypothetical protein
MTESRQTQWNYAKHFVLKQIVSRQQGGFFSAVISTFAAFEACCVLLNRITECTSE